MTYVSHSVTYCLKLIHHSLQRVLNYIEIGKREGATLETGGVRSGSTGFFIEPTVFTDVTKDMQIVREEIFGPVAVIIKFKDEAEVIELANDTTYGLAAVVFSQNIGRALRVAHALEAGASYVNMSAIPDFQISFGGIKQSGFGKDMGEYALESYVPFYRWLCACELIRSPGSRLSRRSRSTSGSTSRFAFHGDRRSYCTIPVISTDTLELWKP